MASNRAVILGATSSLGQSVARELANQFDSDMTLLLVGRDVRNLSAVANDLTARGVSTEQYVYDFDDIDKHDALLKDLGDADSYWFFYGTLPNQYEAESKWRFTEAAIHNNFLSAASLLTRIANILEERNSGSIVVVTSVAGDRGRKSNYVYGTAKGALNIFSQGLRNRLHGSSVHLLTVKPGFIDTPMTEGIKKVPAFLWVGPSVVAKDIVKAYRRKKDVVYSPWFWRYILFLIKVIPEKIFKKLAL